MFLRKTERRKNGTTHLYWSVVGNKRLGSGRGVQRHVLYLGEINSSQAEAWRKAIEVFDENAGRPRALALFPEDRRPLVDDAVTQVAAMAEHVVGQFEGQGNEDLIAQLLAAQEV